MYDIKSIKHSRFLQRQNSFLDSLGLQSHDALYIVLSKLHCLFMLTNPEILFNGLGDIFLLLQAVPFKSHCSLPLDLNTIYLAFRYSLLSFSLNCSTTYSPLQFSLSVSISSWVSVTYLLSHLNVSCSSPTSLAWEHFNVHCFCSVLLDPVFSFNVQWFFVLFNNLNNHWVSSFVPFILHMFCSGT